MTPSPRRLGGAAARHPVTPGRPRSTPAPGPQVFTVSRGCLEFKPSAYLHREGAAGRAGAGSVKTSGRGEAQARPGHRGCDLGSHSRPGLSRTLHAQPQAQGPQAPSPPPRAGRRRKVIHSVSIHQVQEARLPPEAHGRQRACPGPPSHPPPGTDPRQPLHSAFPRSPHRRRDWETEPSPNRKHLTRVQTHLRLAIRAATKARPRTLAGGTGCLRPGQRRGRPRRAGRRGRGAVRGVMSHLPPNGAAQSGRSAARRPPRPHPSLPFASRG